MTKEQCKGLFELAGIPVLKMWELPNSYWPHPKQSVDDRAYETETYLRYAKIRDESPWWLVRTRFGLVEIGWRKRVIQIDWSDTDVRCIVTEANTTKGETMVHARDNSEAVKYLTVLGQFANLTGNLEGAKS